MYTVFTTRNLDELLGEGSFASSYEDAMASGRKLNVSLQYLTNAWQPQGQVFVEEDVILQVVEDYPNLSYSMLPEYADFLYDTTCTGPWCFVLYDNESESLTKRVVTITLGDSY